MITLHGFGADWGLPEISPFVIKTEVHLKMAGLAYRKARSRPESSPKGQLPWIDDDGVQVADSHFIRIHLEEKYGVDFDEGLSEVERARAWVLERMVENHLAQALAYVRWIIPENFARGPARWFEDAPEPMRTQLRQDLQRRVFEALRAQGVARHSPQEILELGVRSLSALSLLLGEGPFLMGNRICGADAACFGVLAGVMSPYFDSPLRREAEGVLNLVAYVERMMARFYPEHATARATAEPA